MRSRRSLVGINLLAIYFSRRGWTLFLIFWENLLKIRRPAILFSPHPASALTLLIGPIELSGRGFGNLATPTLRQRTINVVSSGVWRSKICPATNSSEIGNWDTIVFIISNDRPSLMSNYVNFCNFSESKNVVGQLYCTVQYTSSRRVGSGKPRKRTVSQ